MRRWNLLFAGLALAALMPVAAQAQQGAACPIASTLPTLVSATTYTLSAADNCKMLVFTSGSGIAVTMPNPAVALPVGFRVSIKSQGAGTVTLGTPTVASIDGTASAFAIVQGSGVEVRSDAVNYYTSGLGVKRP